MCAGLGVARANAATIVVNNAGAATQQSCNLEQAVAAANADVAVAGCAAGSGADSILFAQGLVDIFPTSTLFVTQDLEIHGEGQQIWGLTSALFDIGAAEFGVFDLKLRGGRIAVRAGEGASVLLERVAVDGFDGHALIVQPTAGATILDTLFERNALSPEHASSWSGGGAVVCAGTCSFDRVTFDNNSVSAVLNPALGGAAMLTSEARATFVNATFVSNFASSGGGLYAEPGAAVDVSFSTFGGNGAADGDSLLGPISLRGNLFLGDFDVCSAGVVSFGYNDGLEAECATATDTAPKNQGGPVAFYRGGYVPVVDLPMGHYARDRVPGCEGLNGVVTRDAAGRTRPQGDACDTGAREALIGPEFEMTPAWPSPYFSPAVPSSMTIQVRVDNHADVMVDDVGVWIQSQGLDVVDVSDGCSTFEGSPTTSNCVVEELEPHESLEFAATFSLTSAEPQTIVVVNMMTWTIPTTTIEHVVQVRYCGDGTLDPEEVCEPSLSEGCSTSCAWSTGEGGAGGEAGLGGEAGASGEAGAPPLGGAGEGGEGASDSSGAGGSMPNGGTRSSGGNGSGGRASGGTGGLAAGGAGATAGEPHEGGYGGDSETPGESDEERHSKGCACGVASQNGTGLGWLSLCLAGAVWWRRVRRTKVTHPNQPLG